MNDESMEVTELEAGAEQGELTGESSVDSAYDDFLFDGWGDDSEVGEESEEAADSEDETSAEYEETDQSEEYDSETDEQSHESREPKKNADQRFKLKHFDEIREVGLDEMTALAQKGMDYDRIREERDNLKAGTDFHEEFLKEFAETIGISVDELIENSYADMEKRKAENEGRRISDDDARNAAKSKIASKTKKKEEPPKEDGQSAQRKMIVEFVTAYPDVKPEDIPNAVWDEAVKTGNLAGAYARYENKQLKKRIETLENNNKNKARSTGSRKSAGGRAESNSHIFDGWDD